MAGVDELAEERAALAALLADAGVAVPAAEASSDEEEEETVAVVDVAGVAYQLTLVPDDGGVKSTLFACQIWNGARYIAEYVAARPSLVAQQSCVEFGAACALPSLVALRSGAELVLITDYPDERILGAIEANVAMNHGVGDAGTGRDRWQVAGHKWGEDVASLRRRRPQGFDVAFLAECLWLHQEHENLLKSLDATLRVGGIAVVSYAHHVPNCEALDDAFFIKATEGYGFEIVEEIERGFPKMWNEAAVQPQYLRVLRKTAPK